MSPYLQTAILRHSLRNEAQESRHLAIACFKEGQYANAAAFATDYLQLIHKENALKKGGIQQSIAS